MSGIGSLNEKPLHASLKEWCRRPGDRVEAPVEGFVADLLRPSSTDPGELIEIQTGSFGGLGRKLDQLLDRYRVRVVHPVAAERWIVKRDVSGKRSSRRKSPKRGVPADVCAELVAFPTLLSHPRFTLEIAMTQEDEVRQVVGREQSRSRREARRGWSKVERRLLGVLHTVALREPADLWCLVPAALPPTFTTRELATAIGRPRTLAQKLAYCLRMAEVVDVVGRDRSGVRYRRR